jgi:putative transcriptional regulator
MTKTFESMKQGLQEAIAHTQGASVGAIIHEPSASIDVKAVRKQVGMTQAQFAASLCISLGTLQRWERGDRMPRGPALVLLHVVAKEPKAVLRALSQNTT